MYRCVLVGYMLGYVCKKKVVVYFVCLLCLLFNLWLMDLSILFLGGGLGWLLLERCEGYKFRLF